MNEFQAVGCVISGTAELRCSVGLGQETTGD